MQIDDSHLLSFGAHTAAGLGRQVGAHKAGEGAGTGGIEAGDIADLLVGQRTARGGGEHGIDVGWVRSR